MPRDRQRQSSSWPEAVRLCCPSEGQHWGYQIAAVHANRGEADEAFRWLERASELHDSGIVLARMTQLFQRLQSDARRPRFLEKVGLVS